MPHTLDYTPLEMPRQHHPALRLLRMQLATKRSSLYTISQAQICEASPTKREW
jgi:hypothetical protein